MQFSLLYLIFFIPGTFEAFICIFVFFRHLKTITQIAMGVVLFLLFNVTSYYVAETFSALISEKIINEKDSRVKIATDINEHSTKVTMTKNALIGKEYVLKAPMFFLKNLPKGARTNISSVHVAPNSLVEFRNRTSNGLDHKRIEGKYRLELLPVGSKIKVVGSFELVSGGLFNISKIPHLIVEDEKRNQAEISELGFELNVINEKGENFDYHQPLMSYIDKFRKENKLDLVVCDSLSGGHDVGDAIDSSKYIEVRLLRFLSDFDLLENVEISKIGYGINNEKMYSCVKIHFKSLDPLFLYYYYGQDWRLYTEIVDGTGKIIKRIGEFQDFDYQRIKKSSEKDLENYRRLDGFKKIDELNQKNYILPVVELNQSDEATSLESDNNETITISDMVKEASERARLMMIENPNDTTKPLSEEQAK